MSLGALLLISLCASRGECSKVYRFTGKVTSLGKNSVTVRRGNEEAEFARPTGSESIHKGDRITVLYSMDAQQVIQSPQAPGSVSEGQNGVKEQHLILDDRAFYNAKNQAHPTEKNPG